MEFDQARLRNTAIWQMDSLVLVSQLGMSHALADHESMVNSLHRSSIETEIWLLVEAHNRRVAQLAALLALELAGIDQQLTLTQERITNERARLSLQVLELQARIEALWAKYFAEQEIQYVRERALEADRSVEIRAARVTLAEGKALNEIDLLQARIDEELVRLQEVSASNSRLEMRAEEVQFDQERERITQEEIAIDLVGQDARLGEVQLRVEREELAIDDTVVERDEIALRALRAGVDRAQQLYLQDSVELDWKKIDVVSREAAADLLELAYRKELATLEKLEAEVRASRIGLSIQQEVLRQDALVLRVGAIEVEQKEIAVRKREGEQQGREYKQEKDRTDFFDIRADTQRNVLDAEFEDVDTRRDAQIVEIEARAENIAAEKQNIINQLQPISNLLSARLAEIASRLAALIVEGDSELATMLDRLADEGDDKRSTEVIVQDRKLSRVSIATKGTEVEMQRRIESFLDMVAAVQAAETYAQANVTTNLIQTLRGNA